MFAKVFAVLSVLSFALGVPVEAKQLETRITHTGRATYFSTGLGACGWVSYAILDASWRSQADFRF